MFNWIRDWFARRREQNQLESAVIVQDTGEEVSVTYPDGTTQGIGWDEIDKIEIQTNDSGPFGADVWWILTGKDRHCTYPQGAAGEPELLQKFQALEDFDNAELIRAMISIENQIFLCWKRSSKT